MSCCTMAKNRHRSRQYPYMVYMTIQPCQLPATPHGQVTETGQGPSKRFTYSLWHPHGPQGHHYHPGQPFQDSCFFCLFCCYFYLERKGGKDIVILRIPETSECESSQYSPAESCPQLCSPVPEPWTPRGLLLKRRMLSTYGDNHPSQNPCATVCG